MLLLPALLPAPFLLPYAPRCAIANAEQWPEPDYGRQPLEQPLDRQPLELEFAAAAFKRPTTCATLMRYLLGPWRLRKAMTYDVGGISGRFDGEAEWTVLPHDSRTLLAYSETGRFRPVSGQLSSVDATDTLETRNQLIYDFSGEQARG